MNILEARAFYQTSKHIISEESIKKQSLNEHSKDLINVNPLAQKYNYNYLNKNNDFKSSSSFDAYV